ncbi:MAG TPA: DUF2306 domain-containing protein [Thermoanaerobaculia bacterium]|jgi:uncharacterized membrane protein
MLLAIHIAAGAAAMILGAVALLFRKGGSVHRRSGMLFVYAMLVMGISASILELLKTASPANVVAALMSMYFVGTAVAAVRRPSRWTRTINIASLTVALALALVSIAGGLQKVSDPGRSSGGVPFRTIGVMSFVLAAILLLAAAGDVRMVRVGVLRGGARLHRHLWRMCFALFIAAGSFFSIRERVARVLPPLFTTGWMRALPILLLFAAMFYWMVRVRIAREPIAAGAKGELR